MLEILFKDEFITVVNKPAGMLVHKTKLGDNSETFVVSELQNQLNIKVFPIHRLDRKTSGVLLFSLNSQSAAELQQQFFNSTISKTYLAIVRGFTPESLHIDYPLKNEKEIVQEAQTDFVTLKQAESNFPSAGHETSRYSLVRLNPITGRYHQLRKHMAHIHHPIIGDRPHGCNKQNKLFKEKFGLSNMLLHASELSLVHPKTNEKLSFRAKLPEYFEEMLKKLGL